MSLDVNTSTP